MQKYHHMVKKKKNNMKKKITQTIHSTFNWNIYYLKIG